MSKTEKIPNKELFKAVANRLSDVVGQNYGGNRTAFSKKLGVSPSVSKSWLDGEALPGGRWLAQMARLGINVHWLLTGEEPEAPTQAADPDEVTRLRADLSTALTRIEALTNQLNVATREGITHARRALDLDQENQRLRGQIISMGLGAEQMADVEDIHKALGLRGPVDVEQVLHAAATSFRAVDRGKSPPTVHEPAAKLKGKGEQGAGPAKRRRATSS